MKNKLKLTLLAMVITLIFAGCGRSAQPNFYNGGYYMAGDDNCRRMSRLSDTRINCFNSDGKNMGYRERMTDQQLSMYRHNSNIRQQQSQQLNQSIQNMNNQMNYNNQQMMNRNNVYKVRPVGPYGY
ncbi:MAG: hypothetical protein U9N59_10220 [Campylobacterota bacterium]|nr:hypothetical protein [Campylobacterota bacterium]